MRKLVAFVLATCVMFSITVPSFASTVTDQAKLDKLVELGVIKGEGNGVDATKEMTRYRSIVMLLRLKGLEDDMMAFDFEGKDTFVDAEGQNDYQKRLMAFLKANPEIGVNGYPDGTFRPYEKINAQQFAKVLLESLKYEDPADYTWGTVPAKAAEIGLVANASDVNMDKILKVLDFSVYTYDALTLKAKGSDVTLGEEIGTPIVVTELNANIKSAVAVNSKVIEVTLNDAVKTASNLKFTVTKGSTDIAVKGVKVAPWNTDNKVILVTLEKDAEAGSLYTIKSGETTANFGGISADKAKPSVTKVESTDYNEITVTFDEPVLADTVTFTATEKYGSKTELAPSFKAYAANNKLVYSTANQKSSTLYGTSISGATDLAGNVMDKDTTRTFVGQSINTVKQSVTSAKTTDSLTVEVTFGINVDKASALDASNYTVTEKYGSKAEINVASVAMALDSNDQEIKNKVVLTLATDTKSSTLYGLEVKNVGTLYGKELDTAKDEATFTGMAKDEKAPNAVKVETISNTEIKVSFEYNTAADKLASDVDASLVAVTEKYGSQAALNLTVKKVKDNYIIFTTSAQKSSTLYEVKVAKGIKDAKGNVTSEELKTTFVGKQVAAKITSVTAVNSAEGKELLVTFDQNYGAAGLDVSSYYIDGGIGYPTKVSAVEGEPAKVKLMIKATSLGKLYNLTVNNVKNSDGIAMDSKGVKTTFVGTGSAPALATFEAAVAVNNQTVKLYFNKDVKDLGLLNSDNTIAAGTIQYDADSFGSGSASADFQYGWIDPSNPKVLVVYTTVDNALNDGGSNDAFDVKVVKNTVDAASNKNIVMLAESTVEPTPIKIEAIDGINDSTLVIYFNQPVRHLAAPSAFAYVEMGSNSSYEATDALITNARAITNDFTRWEVSLDKKLGHAQYRLNVTDDAASKISTLVSGTSLVGFDANARSIVFAGNDTEDLFVKDVYASMPDKRTVKVYFPEAMNVSHVENVANYKVFDAQTGGSELTNSAIVDAKWDASNNSVTLTTNDDFTSASNYYLAVANTVKNALGTKTVKKDASTDLRSQFAVNDDPAAKVTVASVESSAAGKTITVKFNQKLMTATDVDGAVAELAKLLAVKVNGTDAATITGVEAKLGSTDVNDTTAGYFDTLVITVSDTLVVNASGTVDFVGTITNAATGINGEAADTDMNAVIFVQR